MLQVSPGTPPAAGPEADELPPGKPSQQDKRYSDWLLLSQHARWIVTCIFQEFWVYNMDPPKAGPDVIQLKNLDKEWAKLNFLLENNEGNKL